MHNVVLIGTVHNENGKCNSEELYKIIEKINPEIIFLEIPPSVFNKNYSEYYRDKNGKSLETSTIMKYLENHQDKQIDLIPVDCDEMPPASFFKDNDVMHKKIEKLCYEYRLFTDWDSTYRKEYGFKYLNSIFYDNNNQKIYNSIGQTLERINNEKLFQTYSLWNDVNEKRECDMINNIYTYSKEHKYNKGLFLIGAAHRKSIINKIQEYEGTEKFKINWNYENYEGIL